MRACPAAVCSMARRMSRRVAEAVGLGYVGVDVVIDAQRGPMLLEANARPGLAIQIANGRGLLPRLEEIDARLDGGVEEGPRTISLEMVRQQRRAQEAVRRMLKENGAPPSGKWGDIAVLEPVRDYKARHASTMLTFDAVTAAIDQIEAKRRAAMAAE